MQAALLCDFKDSISFEAFMNLLNVSIQDTFGIDVFESTFKEVSFKSYDGRNLVLSVKSDAIKNAIFLHYQNRFNKIVKKTFENFFNERLQNYDIIVEAHTFEEQCELQEAISNKNGSLFNLAIGLEKKYTFDNFLEDETNKLIFGMTKHFAETISETSENVIQFSKQLFICGGIGNGKTHLAQSVASYVLKESNKKVFYTTAEKFMFNFQMSVKNNTGVEFREEFSGVKLLIIDDIHLIATKKKTISEVQRVAYSVLSEGGFVIFCSSGAPSSLPIESENVRSFLKSFYVVRIKDPTEDFRFKILKAKTASSKYRISDATLKVLASKIQTNIRELEGAMGRMVLHSQILSSEIDPEAANLVLTDIFPHRELKRFSITDIQNRVAVQFGISVDEMKSSRRVRSILKARQVAIFIASKLTTSSYVEIGKHFGGRKHSTVIHSIKAIDKLSNQDPIFKNELELLMIEIKEC